MSCKVCSKDQCGCNDRVLSVTIGVPGPKGDPGTSTSAAWKILYNQELNTSVQPGVSNYQLFSQTISKNYLTDNKDQIRILISLSNKLVATDLITTGSVWFTIGGQRITTNSPHTILFTPNNVCYFIELVLTRINSTNLAIDQDLKITQNHLPAGRITMPDAFYNTSPLNINLNNDLTFEIHGTNTSTVGTYYPEIILEWVTIESKRKI